jgi:hypothetical protein
MAYDATNPANIIHAGQGGTNLGSSFDNVIGVAPVYNAPTYTPPPDYVAPTYDEGRIESLAQQKAAPGLRAARSQIQQIQGKYEENPNVKAMTLREALAGYGLAVANVMGGAETSAESEYGREYGTQERQAEINYQGATTTAQTQFQGALASASANLQSGLTRYQDLFQNYMKQQYGGPSATPAGTPAATNKGKGTGVNWAKSTDTSSDPWAPGGNFNPNPAPPNAGGTTSPSDLWWNVPTSYNPSPGWDTGGDSGGE